MLCEFLIVSVRVLLLLKTTITTTTTIDHFQFRKSADIQKFWSLHRRKKCYKSNFDFDFTFLEVFTFLRTINTLIPNLMSLMGSGFVMKIFFFIQKLPAVSLHKAVFFKVLLLGSIMNNKHILNNFLVNYHMDILSLIWFCIIRCFSQNNIY